MLHFLTYFFEEPVHSGPGIKIYVLLRAAVGGGQLTRQLLFFLLVTTRVEKKDFRRKCLTFTVNKCLNERLQVLYLIWLVGYRCCEFALQ